MAVYDNELWKEDARRAARTMHAAFERMKFVQDRWNNGPGTSIPNSGATAKWHTIMGVIDGQLADLQANTNQKLKAVMAISDLTLPGA